MNELVVEYDRELVKTNKGLGLVCELLKDDDGKLSKSKKKITYFSAGKNAKDLINYKNSLERRKKVLQEKVDDLVKEENNIANGKKKIFEKFQDIVDAKGNKQRKFCKHWQKNNLEDKQIYQIVKKGSNSNIVPPSL